jgi:hypothetical protein
LTVEGEMSTPRDVQGRVPPHSGLSFNTLGQAGTLRLQTPVVYLGPFPDDTSIYETNNKEDYVLRRLQRGLGPMKR